MRTYPRDRVEKAIKDLTEAIIDVASARNQVAREVGYDVDNIEERASDESKLMERLRAIRQELEDLEFKDFL